MVSQGLLKLDFYRVNPTKDPCALKRLGIVAFTYKRLTYSHKGIQVGNSRVFQPTLNQAGRFWVKPAPQFTHYGGKMSVRSSIAFYLN